jgi:putative sterol carrier protein
MAQAVPQKSQINFAKFRALNDHVIGEPTERDLKITFERMAERLRDSGLSGTVQIHVQSGENWQVFAIRLGKRTAELLKNAVEKPSLAAFVTNETWWAIAAGKVAPLEAFVRGQIHIRGQYRLAPRLMKHLAAGEGRVDIC